MSWFRHCVFAIMFAAALTSNSASSALAESDSPYRVIDVRNFSEVELGYALPTRLGVFSPNGKLMAVSGDGVYDLVTGQLRFQTVDAAGFYPAFSPDSQLLAAADDGLYDVNTGERLLKFIGKYVSFSHNGKLLAVSEDGVYDVATLKRLFQIAQEIGPYPNPIFSPDDTLLAASRDGVYDLSTKQKLYSTYGFYLSYSSDSTLLVTDEGVYDSRTGESQFQVPCQYCDVRLSPSGKWLAVDGDAVYSLPSYERRFEIGQKNSFANIEFSPDETLVVADGVYNVETGQKVASVFLPGVFSQNGRFFAAGWDKLYDTTTWKPIVDLERNAYFGLDDKVVIDSWDGVYDSATGQRYNVIPAGYIQFNPDNTLLLVQDDWYSGRTDSEEAHYCLVHGLQGSSWPYRSGLVWVEDRVNLRESPNLNSAIVTTTTRTNLPIFATNPDRSWYRIGKDLWVASQAVQTIALPDGVPIEEG